MRIGPRPDAMKPDIHCVGTRWIRGFMAFQLGPGADGRAGAVVGFAHAVSAGQGLGKR